MNASKSVRTRTYSTQTEEAVRLLGMLIRTARIEKKMTARELSERAGISRDLLYRIEKGELRCEIGAVFETAAIVGVPLFDPDQSKLGGHIQEARDRLTLLPKSVRSGRRS